MALKVMMITLGSALVLFLVISRRMKDQQNCLASLATAQQVRQVLETGYSGYIFLADVLRFPQNCEAATWLRTVLTERRTPLIMVDGPSMLEQDPGLEALLAVQYLPSLVRVRGGKVTGPSCLAVPDRQFTQRVMRFLGIARDLKESS